MSEAGCTSSKAAARGSRFLPKLFDGAAMWVKFRLLRDQKLLSYLPEIPGLNAPGEVSYIFWCCAHTRFGISRFEVCMQLMVT